MTWIVIVAAIGFLIAVGTVADARARRPEPGSLGVVREFVATAHVFWGVVTALLFVPAGLLLAYMALGRGFAAVFGALLAAVCVNGLFYVKRAFALPRALAVGDVEEVRFIAGHAAIHHLAVAVVFALGYTIEPFDVRVVLIPCAIGAMIAAGAVGAVKEPVELPVAFAVLRGKRTEAAS